MLPPGAVLKWVMAHNVLGGALESSATTHGPASTATPAATPAPRTSACIRRAHGSPQSSWILGLGGQRLVHTAPRVQLPGLQPGDQWCLCAGRWQQALEAGWHRPSSSATRDATLEWVELGDRWPRRGAERAHPLASMSRYAGPTPTPEKGHHMERNADATVVSVERIIHAPAASIFTIVATPPGTPRSTARARDQGQGGRSRTAHSAPSSACR